MPFVAIRNSTYPRPVSTISERDASALLAFVGELHRVDEPLAFPPRVLAGLRQLIPSAEVGYSELDPAAQASVLQVWDSSDGDEEVETGSEGSSAPDLWWQLRSTHPVCGYRAVTGDWTTPYKASDFVTLREFRRTSIYDAFYRGFLDYWLDVGLASTPTRTRVFIFTRLGGRDFDERDRLVLKLLQPHLAERAGAASAAARGAAALAALEEGGHDTRGRVVLCSGPGVIEYASPSSRALLKRYAGTENGRLPAGLLARPELVLGRGDRRLHVRVASAGGLHVLVLAERDVRVERLTGRERQILEHAAHGRGNEEIAFALGIATATVAKHLERVYRKLGVTNRTAAAAYLQHLPGSPGHTLAPRA